MLRAKDFRQRAWNRLRGNWTTMVVIGLVYLVLLSVMGGSTVIGVGAIAVLILGGPLMLGLVNCFLALCRNKTVNIEDLFSGFHNFMNSMVLYIINTIFIALWSLLFVIPGIIKTYSYSMSYYILADNPGMEANEARKMSMQLMHGNKWRLFCLHLSFLGWLILCALTFGILTFWVFPYIQTAQAEFYQELVHWSETSEGAPTADPEKVTASTESTDDSSAK
jgi:uncharacterized membrane protein